MDEQLTTSAVEGWKKEAKAYKSAVVQKATDLRIAASQPGSKLNAKKAVTSIIQRYTFKSEKGGVAPVINISGTAISTEAPIVQGSQRRSTSSPRDDTYVRPRVHDAPLPTGSTTDADVLMVTPRGGLELVPAEPQKRGRPRVPGAPTTSPVPGVPGDVGRRIVGLQTSIDDMQTKVERANSIAIDQA